MSGRLFDLPWWFVRRAAGTYSGWIPTLASTSYTHWQAGEECREWGGAAVGQVRREDVLASGLRPFGHVMALKSSWTHHSVRSRIPRPYSRMFITILSCPRFMTLVTPLMCFCWLRASDKLRGGNAFEENNSPFSFKTSGCRSKDTYVIKSRDLSWVMVKL